MLFHASGTGSPGSPTATMGSRTVENCCTSRQEWDSGTMMAASPNRPGSVKNKITFSQFYKHIQRDFKNSEIVCETDKHIVGFGLSMRFGGESDIFQLYSWILLKWRFTQIKIKHISHISITIVGSQHADSLCPSMIFLSPLQ